MHSGLIDLHVWESIAPSFLVIESYSAGQTQHNVFVHSPLCGACCQLSRVMNEAAADIRGWPSRSPNGMAKTGAVGLYSESVFNVIGNRQTVFSNDCTVWHSHQQ